MAYKITQRHYYIIALIVVGLFILGAFIVRQFESGVKADTATPHLPDYTDTSTDFAPDIFADTSTE